jgi:transposase
MSHISEHDRWTIVAQHESGVQTADIHRQHGWSKDTIRHWIRQYEHTGTVADAPRPGRPTKVTRSVQQSIRQHMANQQRRSLRYMAHHMRRQQIADISYRTIARAAHNLHLQPYHIRYQPNITPEIATRRIHYANSLCTTRLESSSVL